MMQIENVQIKGEDYNVLKDMVKKGVNIVTEEMDYLEFYCTLCILNALNVPLEMIHITDMSVWDKMRNLEKELPCEMEFCGCKITVQNIA